ncbi:MAG: signal peptidase I [Lachnospiraceae bacterium]|nr:signal peptidase I [Lachnospiraceae bacterium]
MRKNRIIQLVCILLSILFLWFCLKTVLLIRFVPSESMMQTIMPNDILFVNHLAYKHNNIKRGDIIVFSEDGKDVVKRVIGLPDDIIEIKQNVVYVNGEALVEEYVVGNTVSNISSYTVPRDCYFVLGDNRENSNDSRLWDEPFLSKSNIKGRVFVSFGILPKPHIHAY